MLFYFNRLNLSGIISNATRGANPSNDQLEIRSEKRLVNMGSTILFCLITDGTRFKTPYYRNAQYTVID